MIEVAIAAIKACDEIEDKPQEDGSDEQNDI